ncbi:unnamed protein product [Urochloa humidicola]
MQPLAGTTTTSLESVASTHCAARMDDYMDALNAASIGISGDLLDETQGVGHADSSMSGSAAPPPVPRKAARNKQSNFSAFEDNVPCLFCLCDCGNKDGLNQQHGD